MILSSGGAQIATRERHRAEWSLNGAATTTVLFGRMPIHTGSDAAPTGTVHGIIPLPSGRASRLRRVCVDNPNTWGVSAFYLMTAQHTGGTYAMTAIAHVAIAQYGGSFDFWSVAGVPATRVLSFDASGPTYTAETTDAASTGAGDITVFPATEEDETDAFAVGYTSPFAAMSLSSLGGTAGVGGTVAWEYYNGTTWVALAGVTDGTTGFTATASHGQRVSWTVPTAWAAVELGGAGGALYYVRARITEVYATNPVYSHLYVEAPHQIPAGYLAALGHVPDGAAQGDTRITAEFESAA